MALTTNRLRSLGEGEFPSPEELGIGRALPSGVELGQPTPQPARMEAAATAMLLTSLRALSQRALVATSHLFVLLTAGSAWWLWRQALPDPSVLQLVGLALYGGLILALDWMVLRRR